VLPPHQVFKLPPERVFVSVYEDDDDAYALWRDAVGVPETHIHRLGAEDNFWESGPTGALETDSSQSQMGPSRLTVYQLP
jgi:alanyl-tRNA synthetase